MGKGIEKREKGEILKVLGRKNLILEKGGGTKIFNFWEIYTPVYRCYEKIPIRIAETISKLTASDVNPT